MDISRDDHGRVLELQVMVIPLGIQELSQGSCMRAICIYCIYSIYCISSIPLSGHNNIHYGLKQPKRQDCSTGPLARPFARLLATLTRSLATDCSLRSRPPLRSFVRSLAHFAHFLTRGKKNDWMAILSVFFSIFDHSESCSPVSNAVLKTVYHYGR